MALPRFDDVRRFAADYIPGVPRPAPKFVTEAGVPVHGLVAEYDDVRTVYHAAEMIRDAGYRLWDVHSPFPIHGIEEAMGIRRTILPVLAAIGGFTGAGLGFLMQWWMTSVDYPLVVQGKPPNAWEPWVPVTFEVGILVTAFTVLIGMLALNGLPRWHHPLFNSDRFLRISDDRFMIVIDANDPSFDPASTRELLERSGGRGIDLIEDAQ